MSAESPRHARLNAGGPLTVPPQPPSDRSIIDAVSGFINDVTLSSSSTVDPKDVIQWARFETADINEPVPEDCESDTAPLLLTLGYGSGVQVWLVSPSGEAQEVLSWRQGTVRVLRVLPTPHQGDCFATKRPLIALCDSASPGPTFCSLSFISIRGGEQVKSIKFKNPILDVLANKRSIVISFAERFAVFDAATLEDRMSVTTCYPCPCPLGGGAYINPLALGDRWLAYADKKLNQSKRSSGGCEGEGQASYTATVLHAAKSLSAGLRGLGESVAQSLAGGRSTSQSPSPPNADVVHPGVVTILDIENLEEEDGQDTEEPHDPIVAHFVAHSEAIIALKFDASGMLLVTADRRGHDFHVFRINPHPVAPSLASVHHLYILHRGDTTAKVQDIAISFDSRWTAISTLRGTTHVFAISPYGGTCGVRTHTPPRVVNRLSRFHRSAGLPIHAPAKRATHSPVSEGLSAGAWYPNPRLPPYPAPVSASPLYQFRSTPGLPTNTITRTSSGRQRLSSLSEDASAAPLLARAHFGTWGGAAALYLLCPGGTLVHLLLTPKPHSNISKEKMCDESAIELHVEGVSQWSLQRAGAAADLLAPLPPSNPLLRACDPAPRCDDVCMSEEERWLSQVEIVTHAGPHRRLWMGPQFVFNTYTCTGSSSSLSEAEIVEVDTSAAGGVARSNPVNMPGVRPIVPVLIDSGSASSLEQSPVDSFRRKCVPAESGRAPSVCDVQLKADLAEAMKEDAGWQWQERAEDGAAAWERAVTSGGRVLLAPVARRPKSPDHDDFTLANADEATFRPVVRAPAPPPHTAVLLRPLPRGTTIPAEQAPTDANLSAPSPPPRTLATHVLIPAEPLPQPADIQPAKTEPFSDRLSDNFKIEALKLDKVELPKKSFNPPELDNIELRKKSFNPPELDNVEFPKKYFNPPELDNVELPKKSFNPPEIDNVELPKKSFNPQELDNVELPKKSFNPPELDNVELRKKSLNPPEIDVSDKVETRKKSYGDAKKKSPPRDAVKTKIETAAIVTENIPKPEKIEVKPKVIHDDRIKTEEQAWDMLLNEPEKSVQLSSSPKSIASEKSVEEPKPRSKKNRKPKKLTGDTQLRTDEDSFVEIHAIEDKPQASSGELVSISTSCRDEHPSPYLSKTKKARSSKSLTPEWSDQSDVKKFDTLSDFDSFSLKSKSSKTSDDISSDIEVLPEPSPITKPKEILKKRFTNDTPKVKPHTDGTFSETTSFIGEPIKISKCKSLSPRPEPRLTINKEKDVYVINTTDEEFPDIQITKGNKSRKLSPQPVERKREEKEPIVEKTVKSWSSIAASKNVDKKVDKIGKQLEQLNFVESEPQFESKGHDLQDKCGTSTEISLQDKLIELCKRPDIMVAQCDAPTELNFVEEHHSVLYDLPPLEPLDFALDDFKLDVMKDSLMDANESKITSPICNINLDEILSTIKQTTSRAVECSAFNLIDLEKVPMKKEKGFSVVGNPKISSQEVKVDDDRSEEKDAETMEKSSDDDLTSPVISTDSDKDDKKSGAASVTLPSFKQPSKPKKSRRKKK